MRWWGERMCLLVLIDCVYSVFIGSVYREY